MKIIPKCNNILSFIVEAKQGSHATGAIVEPFEDKDGRNPPFNVAWGGLVDVEGRDTSWQLYFHDNDNPYQPGEIWSLRITGVDSRTRARRVIEDIHITYHEGKSPRALEESLEDRIEVIHGNFFEVDISDADVVTLYLLTSVNERLRPKLERELKPGTRVVSHDFEVPGWKPIVVEDLYEEWRSHKIYLYKIGGAEIPIPNKEYLESVREAEVEKLDPTTKQVLNLIDGHRSLEEISYKTGLVLRDVRSIVQKLQKLGFVKEVKVIKQIR